MTSIELVQPYPALLLRKQSQRVLVVADLHMGWEVLLAQKGVHVPSQMPKILNKLLRLVKVCKPTRLIFLGDVKDAIAKVEMREWRDIPEFFEALEKKVPEIQVIPGNHDGNLEPLLPLTVEILPTTGFVFGDVGLLHGHTWPAPELLSCRSLVTGHVHPMVTFRDPLGFRTARQVWVKATCDVKRLAKSLFKHLDAKVGADPSVSPSKKLKVKPKVSQLFITPSFNEFLGGRPINERKGKEAKYATLIGPVLRSGCINLDNAETYLLDGTFLGTVKQLMALS